MEEQKVYIGPNVQRLGLMKNQVYLGGIPGHVQAAIAQYPEIDEMIVTIEEFTKARNDINKKGTHLHHVCEEFKRKAGVKV